MPDYRRLISYIYEYEGKEKGKNVGFAKLESRGGQCRLNLNVKRIYVGGNAIGVYLLDRNRQETFLGNIFIRGGSGEFRTTVDARNIEGSGNALDTYCGLTVHDVKNSWRSYTTIWDDAILPETALPEPERAAQPRGASLSGDAVVIPTAQEVLPGRTKLSQPAVSGVVQEIEAELAREEQRGKEELTVIAHAAEIGAASEGQEGPADMQEAGKNLRKGRMEFHPEAILQPAAPRPPVAQVRIPMPPAGEQIHTGLAAVQGPQAAAEPPIPAAQEPRAAATAPVPAVQKPQVAAIAPMPASQEPQAAAKAPAPAAQEPPAVTGGTDPAAEDPRGAARESQTSGAGDPGSAAQEPQDTSSESPVMQKPRFPSPELENPDLLKYLQETEEMLADPEKLWEELRRNYPKIQPFDCEGECEILTIRPQDIGRLPRECWVYGNNSFLLHGYYNFRYLILVRLCTKNGQADAGRAVRYLIGVPGHYYSNEKYMAAMFGFPNFVLSKNQPPNDGRFGYWYTDIRLR